MSNKNDNTYSTKINLDDIIKKGTEINKENILEAEDIKYKTIPQKKESYDEFGFLDKFKEEEEKK